jgi:hypothetical protein
VTQLDPDAPPAEPTVSPVLSRALRDIAAERRRQIEDEGFNAAHDDKYIDGELSRAAACYALATSANNATRHTLAAFARFGGGYPGDGVIFFRRAWPWLEQWWKPRTRREDLVRAGALIVADIERIDRLADRSVATSPNGDIDPASQESRPARAVPAGDHQRVVSSLVLPEGPKPAAAVAEPMTPGVSSAPLGERHHVARGAPLAW